MPQINRSTMLNLGLNFGVLFRAKAKP